MATTNVTPTTSTHPMTHQMAAAITSKPPQCVETAVVAASGGRTGVDAVWVRTQWWGNSLRGRVFLRVVIVVEVVK